VLASIKKKQKNVTLFKRGAPKDMKNGDLGAKQRIIADPEALMMDSQPQRMLV
jgi:hypothetical protein